MLKRTRKVSLLATIFCLIASLLMLVGFQSMSAKAEDTATTVTVYDLADVADVDEFTLANHQGKLVDLGATTYAAVKFKMTIPNPMSGADSMFITLGSAGGDFGWNGYGGAITVCLYCQGCFVFTEPATHNGLTPNVQPAPADQSIIAPGATLIVEVGTYEAGHYYIKVNDTLWSEISGYNAPAGSYVGFYTPVDSYTFATTKEAAPEVVVNDLADVADVDEFTLANHQGKLVDLGATTYAAVKFKMTIPNPMSAADSMFITLGSAGGDFGWNGYGGAITVCLYCQGCFVFTAPATHNGLTADVSPADQSIIAPGATLIVEVGTYEAGHYYIKVNDTLWSEISNYNAPAGSYVGFYTPVDSYTFATTKEIPVTPEVEVKDLADVAGANEIALGAGQGHIVDLGASTYTAIKFKITLPANSIGPDSLFVAFGSNGEGAQYGYAGAVTLCLYCPECLVFTEGGTHNGLSLNENEYVTDDQSAIVAGGGELIIELGAYEEGHYYVKVNDVLWEEVINRPAALGTKVGFYVGNDSYLIQSTTVQPEPEPEVIEKNIADVMGESYKAFSGNVCLGDIGAQDYYAVNMRLTLMEGYNVMFFLNTDGNGTNGFPYGGVTSFKLTNGGVQWGWPGAWNLAAGGTLDGISLEANKTYDVSFGINGIDDSNASLNVFFKVDDMTWSGTISIYASVPDFHGNRGTKLGVSSSSMIIIEDATATCDHAFAWSEPDESKYTEYKCACGIVLDSTYVKTEKNIADVMGESYKVVNGNACLGDVALEDYYTIKMRLTLSENYDVIFFLNSDGETPCNTGAFGGLYSIRLVGGQVMGGYPGGWHFYSDASANVAALTAGATVSLEITMSGYDAVNHIAIWVVKVNGETAFTVNSQAYGPDFMGVTGTKLAVSSATMILVEDATATCAHSFGAKNELVGCTRITIGCANCNVIVESTPEHDFVAHDAVAADCENAGNIAYSECSRCSVKVDADGNVVETVVVDALGHGYQWQNTKNATCTEEGYEGYYTCSACTKLFNAEYVEIAAPVVIGKANHTMTHYDAEAPTCTETGAVEFYQCSTCNKFYADEQGTTEITDLEVPMVAHTYGEWIAQVDATTEAEGTLGHYHCDVCGKDFDAEYEELDSLVIPKVEKPEEPKTDDVSSLFGGCKASLSLGSIGIVALLSMAGVAMVAKRKED